jgi:hypothetical protein
MESTTLNDGKNFDPQPSSIKLNSIKTLSIVLINIYVFISSMGSLDLRT